MGSRNNGTYKQWRISYKPWWEQTTETIVLYSVISLSPISLLRSIHSFIHYGYFNSASSSPLLFGIAPNTALILFRSFTPKRHRQLRVKDLPKVPPPGDKS